MVNTESKEIIKIKKASLKKYITLVMWVLGSLELLTDFSFFFQRVLQNKGEICSNEALKDIEN